MDELTTAWETVEQLVHEPMTEAVRKRSLTQRVVTAESLWDLSWAAFYRINPQQFLSMDEDQRNGFIRGLVARSLKAEKERLERENGQYGYTAGEIRHLLSDDAWLDVERASDVDGRADLHVALKRLPRDELRAVLAAYRDGTLPVSHKDVLRGVDSLVGIMNRSCKVGDK